MSCDVLQMHLEVVICNQICVIPVLQTSHACHLTSLLTATGLRHRLKTLAASLRNSVQFNLSGKPPLTRLQTAPNSCSQQLLLSSECTLQMRLVLWRATIQKYSDGKITLHNTSCDCTCVHSQSKFTLCTYSKCYIVVYAPKYLCLCPDSL